MTEPLKLLSLIRAHCNRCYIWTTYYDHDLLARAFGDQFGARFGGPVGADLVDIVVRPIRNIIYMLLIVQYTAVATPRVVYGSLRTTFWGSFVI